MSSPDEVAPAFGRMWSALGRALTGPLPPLRPPADEDALRRLAEVLGQPAPDELAALLRVADGQGGDPQEAGPLNFHRFLGVDEIVALHTMLDEVVGDLAGPVEQPAAYSRTVWSPGWVPFLADEGHAYLVDTVPGESGVVGQVFFRPNVPDLDEPKADSLVAFLDRVTALVEAGDRHQVELGSVLLVDLF